MDIFDNIRHDLSDASFCVTTAIELLSGIERDRADNGQALHQLIDRLQGLCVDLDNASAEVAKVQKHNGS